MTIAFLFAVCWGVWDLGPGSDELKPDPAIHRKLVRVVEQADCPGVIAAIVDGEQIMAIGAAGRRSATDSAPITVHDRVHLGSCTKAMTATLIGILIDEGKLDWDTRFIDLVPSLRDSIDPAYHGITLEQLLHHRAGVPANARNWWLGRDLPVHQARLKIVADTLNQPPKKPLAGKFLYSNLGYMMAGLMAEQVTHKTWETLMTEKLFQPLGMSGAGFGPPGTKDRLDQPRGHLQRGETLVPVFRDNAPALGPAGTVHCSLADWARFAMLHNGHQPDPQLIRPATLRRLQQQPAEGNYAGGWAIVRRDWAGGKALTHQGSNTFWTAIIWLAPERDFAILICGNANSAEITRHLDQAVGDLIQIHAIRTRPENKRDPDSD